MVEENILNYESVYSRERSNLNFKHFVTYFMDGVFLVTYLVSQSIIVHWYLYTVGYSAKGHF